MPAEHFFASRPEEVGLDSARVEALMERAEREVEEGLLPSAQVAIARHGMVGAMRTFGHATQGGVDKPATNQTFYAIFSCTKAIVSTALWILIGEGKLDVNSRVAAIVPEFGTNGKHVVTVEQVMLHVAGFPNAPYPQDEWLDREKRLERFASWRLEWPPGSKYEYHPTSGFWVLGEIIERLSGRDVRDFVRERIAEPLGLPDLRLGLPREFHSRVADLVYVGMQPTPEELKKQGFPEIPEGEVNEEAITGFNRADVRESGLPGGGGFMTAADLALFYQALVNGGFGVNGTRIWKADVLREALRVRSGDHRDPYFGIRCNRALGLWIAGDDGFANMRGFGRTNSAMAFGHGGAGGQIAWADPATGISFVYCTNGFDRDPIRQGRRGTGLSSRAAECGL
ncbi:MAG: serine hydrolase domain-containing protein [Candidatus Binataceae bacterium]|jgi:CubicO group peptidase (beta-lactamase class C family)